MINGYERLSPGKCAEKLLEIENPIIYIHVRPDGDAVGSAAALCEIFSQLGKDAKITCADSIPARLEFILDYTGAKFTRITEGKTPIAIDVASPQQLGGLWELPERPVLMIDHHAIGAQFADGLVMPDLSSAGEVLYKVARELIYLGKITLTKKLAYALYTSISSDTGRFAYTSASPATYRAAAELMETGIDWANINHRLFSSKSPEEIKAEGLIACKLKTREGGKIAYATLSIEEREALSLKPEHFETAIEIVRSLCGVEIALFLREAEPRKYKASLRSTSKNVAAVAAKFGGGGHILAAGCTLSAESIDSALEAIINEITNN